MRIEVLRRIEKAEKRAGIKPVPNLIMIWYDRIRGWVVAESYERKRKEQLLDHYRDYVIPSEFTGAFILDLFDSPNEHEQPAGLMSTSGNELRRMLNCEGCGLSLDLIRIQDSITLQFEITVIKYK